MGAAWSNSNLIVLTVVCGYLAWKLYQISKQVRALRAECECFVTLMELQDTVMPAIDELSERMHSLRATSELKKATAQPTTTTTSALGIPLTTVFLSDIQGICPELEPAPAEEVCEDDDETADLIVS